MATSYLSPRFADRNEQVDYYREEESSVLKNCGEPGCKNLEHICSEHNLCALHEYLAACEWLNTCSVAGKWTAAAHARALIWKAHFDQEVAQ